MVTATGGACDALGDGEVTLVPQGPDGTGATTFRVERDHAPVGTAKVAPTGTDEGTLTWSLPASELEDVAVRAVRLLATYALERLGLTRVQASVPRVDERVVRVASRAGLLREGVVRRTVGGGVEEHVLLARLSSDPPPGDPRGFRTLLNASLPRKRAIGQLLVRDRDGRVLLCRLTYKADRDLPGGVVEVNESPRQAVVRELKEELDLDLEAGRLLLTDWLPPWSGWDDALCLVFDGGVHDASILASAHLEAREIRGVDFANPEQVRVQCADFTARRVEAALRSLTDPDAAAYTESGR